MTKRLEKKHVCKHENGWFIGDECIFVYPEENYWKKPYMVKIGRTLRNKVQARCNNPNCNAVRNIYFDVQVKTLGKIREVKPND